MADQYTSVLSILLLLINPILSLPLILTGVSRNQKWACYCLAAFMALLGYLVIPTEAEDLSRIYIKFEYMNSLSGAELVAYIFKQMDFFLSGLFLIIGKLGLRKEFIPFTSVMIGYLSYLLVFHDWVKKNPTLQLRHLYIPLIVIVFCSVSFRNYSLNIRNFVAVSALLIGVYQIFFLNKKTGWIWVALAPACHLMTLLVLPLIPLARSNVSNKACRFFFFFSFIGFFIDISSLINEYVLSLSFENESLQNEQVTHFEDDRYVGASVGASYNTNGMIIMIFSYFVTMVMYYYVIKFKNNDSQIRKLVYLTIGLSNLLFYVSIMYGRYIMIAMTMFVLMLMWECREYDEVKIRISYLNKYAFLKILSFAISLYATRQSMESCIRILYEPPLFFVLS